MGSVVGKISDAIGITDNAGAAKANKAAANAADQSLALTKEQIAFQKEQYADWKNVYGDIQTNLGEYYKKLTPEKVTALGLQNQQMEFQQTMSKLDTQFAQKGISASSGVAQAVKATAAFQNAEARATIRTNAEDQVQQQKLGFLGVGLGQGTQMLGIIGNAYNTGIQTQGTISGNYLDQATGLKVQGMKAMNDVNNNMMTMGGFLS